jgi:hypothetical protein
VRGRVARDCWDGWNFEGLCGSAGPRNNANVDAVGQVREIFFLLGTTVRELRPDEATSENESNTVYGFL